MVDPPGGTYQPVVLITGCSSGIGRAVATYLAERGCRIVATARRDESMEALCAWARQASVDALALRLDVTDADQIRAALAAAESRFGCVDVLVNNAGFGQFGAVEDVSPAAWRAQMETNFVAPIALAQAVLPGMRARRRGRIINLSSVVAHVSLPLMGAYCASKYALDAATVAMRMEVRPFGVRVSLVEPGPVATRFRDNLETRLVSEPLAPGSAYAQLAEASRRLWERHLGGKAAEPERIARAVYHAATAPRPRRRYRITPVARVVPRLLPFVPEGWVDRLLLAQLRRAATEVGSDQPR